MKGEGEQRRETNHNCDIEFSHPLLSWRESINLSLSQKETVEELKLQWKRLWKERMDDKIRAEGIAMDDYSELFVEKGTVIHANRDFKGLDFKEILEQHQIADAERFIPLNPQVGGWGKFIKVNFKKRRVQEHGRDEFCRHKKDQPKNQPKKGGRGWLHL